MSDYLTPDTQRRTRALYRYTGALEHGDIETVATVLAEAEHDQVLERMLLEVNETYQFEDHAVPSAADVEATHDFLHGMLPLGDEQEHEKVAALVGRERLSSKPLSLYRETTQVPQGRKVVTSRSQRVRRSWLLAAVAACLVAVFALTAGTGLAQQFFALFQVQHFQTVTVDPSALQLRPLPGVDDFGTVTFQNGSFKLSRHLSRQEANAFVSFPLQIPTTLPNGVNATPAFDGIAAGNGTFTFSTAKVRAYLQRTGHGDMTIPANLDGATYTLKESASMEMHYTSPSVGIVLLVEAPSPTVQATGTASLEQLRDFLLSLPGLPAQLVTQLKSIDLNSGTVPLPVPTGVDSQNITVHGASGVLLANDSSSNAELGNLPIGRLVLWQAHGIVDAVAMTGKDTQQLLKIANSLR